MSDENVERVMAHLTDVRNFRDQEITTEDEVLKVEVQLSNARLLQIETRNGIRLAAIGLSNLIGIPLDTEIEIQTSFDRQPDRPGTAVELASLIEMALARRPELKATENRVKAGEAGVRLARSGRWPQVFLVGDYIYDRPNPRIFPTRDEFEATWDLGVSVALDVWDWGMTGQETEQARAALARARDLRDQLRDGIELEVTQHYLTLEEARERISIAEQAVKQAEESQRIISAKFRNGVALNTELLDADVALLQAKTNYTQTLVDQELSWAALERVTGK